jgi:hypothetical protein
MFGLVSSTESACKRSVTTGNAAVGMYIVMIWRLQQSLAHLAFTVTLRASESGLEQPIPMFIVLNISNVFTDWWGQTDVDRWLPCRLIVVDPLDERFHAEAAHRNNHLHFVLGRRIGKEWRWKYVARQNLRVFPLEAAR